MIKTIYIDSDGVVADFDGYYEHLFGPKTTDAELWKNINSYDNFFAELPVIAGADKLVEFCKATGLEFKVLTATGWKYDRVAPQKIKWWFDNFGLSAKDVICVKAGKDKALYANPSSVLIDDMMKNIEVFEQAGGLGLWHTDPDYTIQELASLINEYNG